MGIDLSIVTATIPEREYEVHELMGEIQRQSHGLPVEHIVVHGNGTVGRKMCEGYNRAKGKYIATVDDDDEVSPAYVMGILEAINHNPDVVTFGMQTPGSFPCWFSSFTEKDGSVLKLANHLCAWKREIALQAPFLPRNYGWDVVWYRALRARRKSILDPHTEFHIHTVLYTYNFSPEGTRTQSKASIADSCDNNGHRIKIVRLWDGRIAAGPSLDRMWVANCELINCSDLKEPEGYVTLDEVVF